MGRSSVVSCEMVAGEKGFGKRRMDSWGSNV